MEVASFVSPIAALDFVREFLTAQQQAFGAEGGIVMDGRDIGTAVSPKQSSRSSSRLTLSSAQSAALPSSRQGRQQDYP